LFFSLNDRTHFGEALFSACIILSRFYVTLALRYAYVLNILFTCEFNILFTRWQCVARENVIALCFF
jgi:hypothetical protein